MQRIYRLARLVASSRASVLARGENGTGRRALERTIHALSGRSGALVSVDCASSTEQTLATCAAQAQAGTLFLHEVGRLEPARQAQLLQLFEARAASDQQPADLRVIASTCQDLASAVETGHFREDLLYRLNVVSIDLPPLRLRGSDVKG